MSIFKKFVSSVATTAILISGISVSSFAYVSSDVTGTDYEDAAKVLGAFEIMVGDAGTGLFRPDDAIKRSEVTKVAVALKGLKDAANSSSTTRFPDVEEGHWATGYINIGTTEGLIIGDDKGNFRPDDNITYSEAITIFVRALGYEPQAQSKGGFPTGYLMSGNSMGLTSGISVAAARSSKPVSRGQIAQLAYNALNINLMEQVGFGNNASYEIVDDTLLTSKLDAKLIEGTVTAVGSSSLEGKGVDKGQIEIDGKIYKTGSADVRNVLGLNVDAYVSVKPSSKDNNTIKAIVATEGKNDITHISADNLDSITSASTGKTINYFLGSKKQKITIANDSIVVYNGKSSDMDSLRMIDSGNIMVLNRDNGKKIVFVNETVNYVIDEVILSSNRITDKYNMSPLTLDREDDNTAFVIEKDNKPIEINDLKEWDVVTLTISEDKTVIYGTVINNTVSGKITEVEDKYVYVGDKKLSVAPNYPDKLSIGDEGIFYLDAEEKIAGFDEGITKSKDYAYIANMNITTGLNASLELEVMDASGKISRITAASKIKVNSKTYSTPQSAHDAIGEGGQLVTMKLNSKGELSEITKSTDGDINEDEFIRNYSSVTAEYNSKTSLLTSEEMEVRVGNNTIVFDIPQNGETTDYSVADKSFFSDGDKYDVSVYDLSEDFTAGVIVVTSSENKPSEESSAIIIDKITTSRDENGDSIDKIYGYQNGERISLTAEKGIFKKGTKSLEAGDIIQAKADAKGKVKSISLLFDIEKSDKEFTEKLSDNLTISYGKVTKKFADSFNLQVGEGSAKNYTIGDAKVHLIEIGGKSITVSSGNSSDIQKFDDLKPERVFVRIYKDEVKDIIIVK